MVLTDVFNKYNLRGTLQLSTTSTYKYSDNRYTYSESVSSSVTGSELDQSLKELFTVFTNYLEKNVISDFINNDNNSECSSSISASTIVDISMPDFDGDNQLELSISFQTTIPNGPYFSEVSIYNGGVFKNVASSTSASIKGGLSKLNAELIKEIPNLALQLKGIGANLQVT